MCCSGRDHSLIGRATGGRPTLCFDSWIWLIHVHASSVPSSTCWYVKLGACCYLLGLAATTTMMTPPSLKSKKQAKVWNTLPKPACIHHDSLQLYIYIQQITWQPGVYLVNFDSGQCCVWKNVVRSSDEQELAIYECLWEYRGITNFIFDWLSGHWSAGKYIQLPHLIPIGDELRECEGGCLKGQTPLFCTQLLSSIQFLHSHLHIAHMDIKPDNLVLDEGLSGRTVKIIDFNTAIVDAELKVLPGAHGTVGYMAPEILGSQPYNPFLADQYSCSMCMMELLNVDRDKASLADIIEKFMVFATRLCNSSPNWHPLLIQCPKILSPYWQCPLAITLRDWKHAPIMLLLYITNYACICQD